MIAKIILFIEHRNLDILAVPEEGLWHEQRNISLTSLASDLCIARDEAAKKRSATEVPDQPCIMTPLGCVKRHTLSVIRNSHSPALLTP